MSQGLSNPKNLKSTNDSTVDVNHGEIQTGNSTVEDLLSEILEELRDLKEILLEAVQ